MPEVKNFCPKTGVGRFDARLEGNELKVKVKLHVGMGLDNQQQSDFEGLLEPLVKQHWEDKFGFRCSTGNLAGVYKPVFRIKYVDDMMNAHFVLNVLDGAGGSESVGRTTYYKVPKTHTGFAPTTAQLFSGSVNQINSSGALLTDLQSSFPFYVDLNGTIPSQHSATQLKFLAKQLAGVAPNTRVRVTTYGGNRGQKRAAVMQILTSAGLLNVAARSSKKSVLTTSKSRSTGSTSYAKVSLKDEIDTAHFDVDNHPLFTYPAAAVHEFGHMLGLMDEYSCLGKRGSDKMVDLLFIGANEQQQWESFNPNSAPDNGLSENVSKGQAKFIKYCHDANVDPPHFGQHSISIMSSGSHFMPCHFVTLWAAIVEMTQGAAAKDDWSIVEI
jgi:hypothetical protein